MRMRIEQFFSRGGSFARYLTPVICIGVLLTGVLAALLVNTAGLHKELQRNTERYADDISAQLAQDISSRMMMRETYIRNLADTISRMPESMLTEELLERKAEYLDMEEIFVVFEDGTTVPADEKHLSWGAHLTESPELRTESQIFLANTEPRDKVFFAAPIDWKQSSAGNGLLVGGRTNALLQQMLQEVDFENQGMSCILDSSGTVIVSPADEAPFIELYNLFAAEKDNKENDKLQQLLADIRAQRSGVMQCENTNGESLMLGYDFLGINDWVLLTLLPSDLFTRGTQSYVIRYVGVIGALLLISMLIFAYIIRSSRRSFRKIQTIALTDSLTGGMNTAAFRINGTYLLREYPQQAYAVVYLNIRNFRRFNEWFGVGNGDKVLRKVHEVLQSCLQKGELLTRASDDHFYLLLECGSEAETRRRLEEALERLEGQLPARFSLSRSAISQGPISSGTGRPTLWSCATGPRPPAPTRWSTSPAASMTTPSAGGWTGSRSWTTPSSGPSSAGSSSSTSSPRSARGIRRSRAARCWSAGSTRSTACSSRGISSRCLSGTERSATWTAMCLRRPASC